MQRFNFPEKCNNQVPYSRLVIYIKYGRILMTLKAAILRMKTSLSIR